MTIVWRDEMIVDNGIIDDDHKCLIEILNRVDTIRPGVEMQSAVGAVLAELATYTETHFEREERLQAGVRFAYANAHHQRHSALARELNAMRAENETRLTPHQMVAFHARLCDFLHHWLIDHIILADLLMKPFVSKMRKHAQGEVPLAEVVRLRSAEKAVSCLPITAQV